MINLKKLGKWFFEYNFGKEIFSLDVQNEFFIEFDFRTKQIKIALELTGTFQEPDLIIACYNYNDRNMLYRTQIKYDEDKAMELLMNLILSHITNK